MKHCFLVEFYISVLRVVIVCKTLTLGCKRRTQKVIISSQAFHLLLSEQFALL